MGKTKNWQDNSRKDILGHKNVWMNWVSKIYYWSDTELILAQNYSYTMGKENRDKRKCLEIKHVIDLHKNNVKLKDKYLHRNVE